MSGTGKRGADRLNMIGVVTVGICGAVLTYVSIVLLEAFYIDDTTAKDRENAFQNKNTTLNTNEAEALVRIGNDPKTEDAQKPEYRRGAVAGQIIVPIDRAIELVVRDYKTDPSTLVPAVGPSTKPDMQPIYGRPGALVVPAEPPVDETAAPVEPAKVEPAPTEATPTEATPTEPAKVEPTPAKVEPTPAKVEPAKKPEPVPAPTPPQAGNAP